MNFRKIFLFLLLIAVIIPGLSLNAQQKTAEQVLRVLVPKSTSSLPILRVAERDREEDLLPGVRVQVDFFANHPQALALLLRGDADLLLTGTSQGWRNHIDGGPLIMLNTGVWGVSSLLGQDRNIKGFMDLKGKKVALPFPGSPLDVQVRFILRSKGLDPDSDVSLIYAPFPQTIALLLSGKIDAAPLPEPLATDLVENRNLIRYCELKDAWAAASGGDPLSPQVSLFATKGRFSADPVFMDRFVRVWRDATEWVVENPGRAAESFAHTLERSKKVIESAIEITAYLVPDYLENRDRVLAFFRIVQRETGNQRQQIQDTFFFSP